MPRHITRDIAAAVLNELPSPFDTHIIERRILRLHTEAVARELLEFRNTGDILHQFSAHFAKWIDTEFEGQIRKTRKVVSVNLAANHPKTRNGRKATRTYP